MRTLTIVAVSLLALALSAAPGSALHCNGNITTIAAGSETIYVDDRADDPNAPPGSGFVFGPGGTWLYLESNGLEGLQSGGTNPWYGMQPILSGIDDCNHANPDQILF